MATLSPTSITDGARTPRHRASRDASRAPSSRMSHETEWTTEDVSSITSGSELEGPTYQAARPPRTNTSNTPLQNKMRKQSALHWVPSMTGFSIKNDILRASGHVSSKDGRLRLRVNEGANRGFLAKVIGAGIRHHLGQDERESVAEEPSTRPQTAEEAEVSEQVSEAVARFESSQPKMNIVIQIIGSRGDIQPFVQIGKILKEQHGHRVRIATHPAFRDFVQKQHGLEFFSVGGDPAQLMAFMVKNPGLIPSIDTLKKGEIGRRRDQMYEMFEGFWRSCVEPTEHEFDDAYGVRQVETEPFVADCIIANPPSFAHIHCAERLGCPLHIMFTFPYTPTKSFPHPLANIKKGNVDHDYTNFMSYPLVDLMTWQGLGDLVNRFRVGTLALDPVSTVWAPGQLYRLHVPYSYMWSPSLVSKPQDWGKEISITGFVFLEMASSYKPPDDLKEFLEAGEPPIYIGFGSIVVDDAKRFTQLIFEAINKAGVRAVINEGWGGIGDKDNTPDNVYMIDNVPHDWLFPRCKAVVHHGGAGTTAAGLKYGRPTVICPFFGDQPFWGDMVAAAKAGAHRAIPYKDLTSDTLAEGVKQALTDEAAENVKKLAEGISLEGDGAANAVRSFHESLPMHGTSSMRCSILEDQAAVWRVKNSFMRLCPIAAELLVRAGKLAYQDLKLLRHYDWNDFQGPGGPITGVGSAIWRSLVGFGKGMGEGPMLIGKDLNEKARYEKRKHQHNKRQKERDKRKSQENSVRGSTAASSTAVGSTATASRLSSSTAPSSSMADGSTDTPIHSSIPHILNAHRENTDDVAGELKRQLTELEAQEQQPRPGIQNRSSTLSSFASKAKPKLGPNLARDSLRGTNAFLGSVARMPMELTLGLGLGLHNLPRLYNDTTVRRPVPILGLHSGLRAARDELFYETYDAWTGLFTQPWGEIKKGHEESGASGAALGCVTGIGKGLGGLIFKQSSALISPIGFAMKGVHREMTKKRSPVSKMHDARIEQGKRDYINLDQRGATALQANPPSKGQPGSEARPDRGASDVFESEPTYQEAGSQLPSRSSDQSPQAPPPSSYEEESQSTSKATQSQLEKKPPPVTKQITPTDTKSLATLNDEVLDSWAIMTEIWNIAATFKSPVHGKGPGPWIQNLKGRYQLNKELDELHKYGALESVGVAREALEARRRGVPLERVLGENRKRLEHERSHGAGFQETKIIQGDDE